MAAEVQFTDGSQTLLFKRLVRVAEITNNRTVNGFGVNSERGPIKIADDQRGRYNPRYGYTVAVPATKDGKLPIEDFARVTSDKDLRAWQEAFENSRDAALRDQETMQRIREERSQTLDSALEVVSKPIDIDAPPPPAAPLAEGS